MPDSDSSPAALAALPDDALMEAVQRQTFRFFWDAAHPVSGFAPDRCTGRGAVAGDLVAVGASGFGVMAIIVAAEREWISRAAALERIGAMLDLLTRATCYHGAFPHFMNGRTGACIPFSRKDDGGDLVETSFLIMGLLCAGIFQPRRAGRNGTAKYASISLWHDVEWDWYARDGREVLYWHWSPNQRLGTRPGDSRLETKPAHRLRAGGLRAAVSD